MKIYWNYRNVPELAGLSNAEVKDRVRAASEKPAAKKALIKGAVVAGLCAAAGSLAGDSFLTSGRWGAAVGAGIGGFLFTQIQMRAIIREIQGGTGSEVS